MTIQHNISQIEQANWKRHSDARIIKALENAYAEARAECVRLTALVDNLSGALAAAKKKEAKP
jgi:hypothetical protein